MSLTSSKTPGWWVIPPGLRSGLVTSQRPVRSDRTVASAACAGLTRDVGPDRSVCLVVVGIWPLIYVSDGADQGKAAHQKTRVGAVVCVVDVEAGTSLLNLVTTTGLLPCLMNIRTGQLVVRLIFQLEPIPRASTPPEGRTRAPGSRPAD